MLSGHFYSFLKAGIGYLILVLLRPHITTGIYITNARITRVGDESWIVRPSPDFVHQCGLLDTQELAPMALGAPPTHL
ncbi:hypothetical protein B0H17DRAFT_1071263 [Mycena rosella]|uniref:Uncharacterized protein n=1 Tax=Mycena rosella TaxID=1033263 RepID=A0AAD7DA77_MYCRO|nr:hypothetical protein B0H17DRAFT_1071263 [Mycena rosella]